MLLYLAVGLTAALVTSLLMLIDEFGESAGNDWLFDHWWDLLWCVGMFVFLTLLWPVYFVVLFWRAGLVLSTSPFFSPHRRRP